MHLVCTLQRPDNELLSLCNVHLDQLALWNWEELSWCELGEIASRVGALVRTLCVVYLLVVGVPAGQGQLR